MIWITYIGGNGQWHMLSSFQKKLKSRRFLFNNARELLQRLVLLIGDVVLFFISVDLFCLKFGSNACRVTAAVNYPFGLPTRLSGNYISFLFMYIYI